MNWMRANLAWMASQSVRTVSVLARPGTPSSRTWPPVSRPMRMRSTMYVLADDDLADLVHEAVDEGALLGDELVQGADVVHADLFGRAGVGHAVGRAF